MYSMSFDVKDRVKGRVKRRLITAWLMALSVLAPVLGGASVARADDDAKSHDARLEGYSGKPVFDADAGVGTYYLLIALLMVLGLSVLFKDAKRSHSK